MPASVHSCFLSPPEVSRPLPRRAASLNPGHVALCARCPTVPPLHANDAPSEPLPTPAPRLPKPPSSPLCLPFESP